MKSKLILLTFLAALFCGCKKDHSCYCPDPLNCDAITIKNSTKEDAKRECENTENPYNEQKCYLVD